jgi:hypothetical protein
MILSQPDTRVEAMYLFGPFPSEQWGMDDESAIEKPIPQL